MNARTNKRGHRDFIHGVEVLLARGQGHADGEARACEDGRETHGPCRLGCHGHYGRVPRASDGGSSLVGSGSLPGAGLYVAQSIDVGPATRGLVVALVSTGDLVGGFAGDAEGTVVNASIRPEMGFRR